MSVKIKRSKHGYVLVVNRLYISIDLSCRSEIKAIISDFGIPHGSTQWVSVYDLRYFWNMYRQEIVAATRSKIYISLWGQLHPVERPSQSPDLTHSNTISLPAQLWTIGCFHFGSDTPARMAEDWDAFTQSFRSMQDDHLSLNISL